MAFCGWFSLFGGCVAEHGARDGGCGEGRYADGVDHEGAVRFLRGVGVLLRFAALALALALGNPIFPHILWHLNNRPL